MIHPKNLYFREKSSFFPFKTTPSQTISYFKSDNFLKTTTKTLNEKNQGINVDYDTQSLTKENQEELESLLDGSSTGYLSDNLKEHNIQPFLIGKNVESFNDSFERKTEKTFKVVYPKNNVFTNTECYLKLDDDKFLKKRRSRIRQRRYVYQDNIRIKIKRRFFNYALVNKLNYILNKSKLYFQKFPIYFVSDINKDRNKKIINMTLLEIIEKQELYKSNELNNYYHNLKVVNDKEIEENEELKEILNKKYCELYKDYLNSKEFIIDEINRLKKKMDDSYIEKYIYLAKHFIEFFSE